MGPDCIRERKKWEQPQEAEWQLVKRSKKSYADVVKSALEIRPQAKPKHTIFKRLSYHADYFHKNFRSDFDGKEVHNRAPEMILPKSNLSGDHQKQLELEFPSIHTRMSKRNQQPSTVMSQD
jgi:hypothetical protein